MQNNHYFRVEAPLLYGKSYRTLRKKTLEFIRAIEIRTKRKPYIRSKFFKKNKVFIYFFTAHLFDKTFQERIRRMRFTVCAFELIEKSTYKPVISIELRQRFYRFYGETKTNEKFIVQVKEDSRGRKFLMSAFPTK